MQVLLSISGFLYDVNCVLPHVMKYLHLWDLYSVVSAVKGHSVIVNGSNASAYPLLTLEVARSALIPNDT